MWRPESRSNPTSDGEVMSFFGDFRSTDSAIQIRTGLIAMFALSLECLLDGLVTEAPIRSWVFHAVVVGLVLWSLVDPTNVSIRSASGFGLIAVGNEALIIAELEAPVRYLLPSSVLFGASTWVLQRSIAVPTTTSHEVTYDDPLADFSRSGQQFSSAHSDNPSRVWAAVLAFAGVALAAIGIFFLPWARMSAIFGSIQEDVSMFELSASWGGVGSSGGLTRLAVSSVVVLSILGLVVTTAGAFGQLVPGLVVPRKIHLAGQILVGVVVAVQIVSIAGVASSTGFQVSSGGWITPTGFIAAGVSPYLDKKR